MTKEELKKLNNLFAENRRWRQELDVSQRIQIGLVHDLQQVRFEKTMLEVKLEQEQKSYRSMVDITSLRIEHLEDDLKLERCRLKQALDVAEGASAAAGSIASLTRRVSDTLEELEVRLGQQNRETEKRAR